MTDNDDATKVHVEGVGGGAQLSKSPNSQQLSDRRINTVRHGVKPPYNPDRLASFLELNETHATAVRKKSRYEVGFGFQITPHTDVDAEEADDQQREVARNFWRGPESRWETGPHQSAEPTTPAEVKELARQDFHSIGWCALEILTDMEGRPVGLAHVPANTIRVRKPQTQFDSGQPMHPETGDFVDGDLGELASRGYMQERDGRRRYFGEAGDRHRGQQVQISGGDDPRVTYTTNDDNDKEPIFVDRENGDVAIGSADGLDNGPANELIFIRNPSPLEQDYGIPDWVSAIRTIGGDEAAKDYNRDFFDNDTIPRFVIKVTGGELTEESREDLREMLHGLREESHRAVILEVEKFQQQIDEDVEIKLEPLGQGISEEMDFQAYREKNEHEIAKVHEVPPILIGVTETSNRSNSDAQVADFARNIIGPEQHKFAQRLYRLIHQQYLGVRDWTIEYELRGADQPAEDAKVARRKISAVRGAIPVDRALEMVGEDPLPDDHPVDGQTLVSQVGREPVGGNNGGPSTDRSVHAPPPENKIGERAWGEVEAELETKEIEQMQFDSSNLDEGLYDLDEQELYLSFQRSEGQSSLYAYVGVPPTEWAALAQASSHGSYHYDHIRLEFPYIEITNFHDRLPEGPMPDAEDVPDDIPTT